VCGMADVLRYLVCIFELGYLSLLDEVMVCCLLVMVDCLPDDWSYSPVDKIGFV
jgi:hypothetical protein